MYECMYGCMCVSVYLCVKWESCFTVCCQRVPKCRDGGVFGEHVGF